MLHLDYAQFLCFTALLFISLCFFRRALGKDLAGRGPILGLLFLVLASKEAIHFFALSVHQPPAWTEPLGHGLGLLACALTLLFLEVARGGGPRLEWRIFFYILFLIAAAAFALPTQDWAVTLIFTAPLGLWMSVFSTLKSRGMESKLDRAWIAIGLWFALQIPLQFFQAIRQPGWTDPLPLGIQFAHWTGSFALWFAALRLCYAAHLCSLDNIRKTGYRIRGEDWTGSVVFPPAILILIIGYVATERAGTWSGRQIQANFLARAETAAAALDPQMVAKLAAAPHPGKIPEYEKVATLLTRTKNMFTDTRYAYVMGRRGDTVIFLAEGRYEDASNPGDPYLEASAEMRAAFETGISLVEGPLKDRWGDWVSALAPLKDPQGRTIALLGMDMAAEDWYAHRQAARLVVIIITGLVLTVAIGLLVAWQMRRHQNLLWAMSEARFRLLDRVIAQSSNGVLIVDMLEPGQPVMFVNHAFTRITGYTASETIGKNCRFLQGTDHDQPELSKLRDAVEARHEWRGTLRNYRKNGTMFWNELSLFPVFDAHGRLTHYVGLQMDVTERRKAEEELLRAKETAEAANRAKSEFLANMSHEIRTPLNGIVGSIELMDRISLDDEHRRLVETIATSSETLLGLINDVLDYSKIESGKVALRVDPVQIRSLLEDCLQIAAIQAERKKILLAGTVDRKVPAFILGDALKIRQILINLIGNAIKFTEKGEVEVSVSLVHAEADRAEVEFRVRDTGIGIPEEMQSLLFRPFVQADSSISKKYSGTGLGLAISSRLATQMGGRLWFESQSPGGTVFFLRLEATVSASAPQSSGLGPLCLCVIEPRPLCRRELLNLAENEGWSCGAVSDEIELERRIRDGRRPDVIVLAGDLPDGESLRQLRKLERSGATAGIPILLTMPKLEKTHGETGWLTGHSIAVVCRPLQASPFRSAITKILNAEAPVTEQKVAEEPPLPAASLRILLVEDNPVNQLVARGMLRRLGYAPAEAVNGEEALHKLDTADFDVVLMDLQMPVMDGITATREIRSRYPTSRQPIIIALTANALKGDRERFLDEGMDDYLSKPLKLEQLREALRKAAALTRAR
jgi:PAS domain S-box-containing protein